MRRRGPVAGDDALERRLVLLMCGTRARREARADEAAELSRQAHCARLINVLGRLQVGVLVGQRLVALGGIEPRLEHEIRSWTAAARERGTAFELLTLAVLGQLERAGIRALALKGSLLAREIHGDVASRSCRDIDILVAAQDLGGAISTIEGMGWRWEQPVSRAARLPVLHETLTRAAFPRVELHWRVHWYEDRFASDALLRADRAVPHGSLRMQPADGLAALILFYARDGFSGLRMAADVAAWWDARCSGEDADRPVVEAVQAYPRLAGPLSVGARLLGSLVGLPARARHESLRWKIAAELAMPFYDAGPSQLGANASLVDLLLAPPKGAAESLRRERQKIPVQMERALTTEDGLSVHLARWEHLLRVTRRWGVAIGPAALRALRDGAAPDRVAAAGVR